MNVFLGEWKVEAKRRNMCMVVRSVHVYLYIIFVMTIIYSKG